MIALVIVGIVALVLLGCLVAGLAMLAGFLKGLWDTGRWLGRRRQGVPPWEQQAPPQANREPVPFEVRAAIWERDGGQCVYCGASEDLTVDHVVPRAYGGSNHPANLQLACRHCNSSKGTHDAPGGSSAHVGLMISRAFRVARRSTNGHH